MKKIERISNAIHQKILSNFYSRLIDWYKITELENEQYEIKFYVNFIVDDEKGLKEFEQDIKEIVKSIEENSLIKIDGKFYVIIINKVNFYEDSILEIIAICERL